MNCAAVTGSICLRKVATVSRDVYKRQHVARGQVLGISGGTGRATGPHLHVAVRWQGVYVNPATLLELTFP